MSNQKDQIQVIETALLEGLKKFYNTDNSKYVKSVLAEIVKSQSDSSKDISKCTTISILNAVKQAIDLELEIDARQHCHLIKLGDTANLWVGYRGFIYAIKRAYPDTNIVVSLVKEGDEFLVNKEGDVDEYTHKVKDPFGDGKVIGGYCYISRIIEGRKVAKIELVSRAEIDKMKDKAKTKNIWNSWFDEKAKVAVLRRGCKLMFAGINNEKINKIIELDNQQFEEENSKEENLRIVNEEFITMEQGKELLELAEKAKINLLERFKINSIIDLPASKYEGTKNRLIQKIKDNENS